MNREELARVLIAELQRQSDELHGSIAPYVDDERGEYVLVDGHVDPYALADAAITYMHESAGALLQREAQ